MLMEENSAKEKEKKTCYHREENPDYQTERAAPQAARVRLASLFWMLVRERPGKKRKKKEKIKE